MSAPAIASRPVSPKYSMARSVPMAGEYIWVNRSKIVLRRWVSEIPVSKP